MSIYETYEMSSQYFITTGQFTLKVRNEAGERSVTIKVKVLDVASQVRYLTVEDISANACTLAWDAPDDDGGCEITNYVVEKRQSSQVNWTQINADLTVRFMKVDHLMKNEDYSFRLAWFLGQKYLGNIDTFYRCVASIIIILNRLCP